jgi:hypothetical protein
MARLPQSAVVLRFVLGSGLVKARQRYDDTSRAIFRRVTLQYAEDTYDTMRKTLEQQVEGDVRAELTHMALLFRRHIITAAGTKTSPSGFLDTATKGEAPPRMAIAEGLPAWAPRNAEYLRRKRAATGGIGWFDNRGWKESQYDARFASRVARSGKQNNDHGLLFREMRQDVWETMFGPISVRFYRARKLSPEDSVANIGSGKKNLQVQIGSLQVRALGKITPAMLPGYTTGTIMASSNGNPALINLVSGYDPKLGYRLGNMRNGVYRPTLEPFLGFFLLRALPHAVNERLRKGSFGSLFK